MAEALTNLYKTDVMIVDRLENSVDYSNDSRYRKLGRTEAAQISGLLQFVPEAAIADASKNLFRVEYPKGVSGYLSKHGNGYLSSVHDFETGDFTGHATFIPVEHSIAVFNTFQALSIITSQYYLHEINQQLSEIQNKLDRILDFLYDDKSCEIYAESKSVFGIYKNYASLMKNETHRLAALVAVQRAKTVAEKNIQFYYRDMNKMVSSPDMKSSSKAEAAVNNLRDDLNNYNQAMNLFGVCTILEILLSQNYDKEYLQFAQVELEAHIDTHNILLSKLQGKLEQLTEGSDRFPIKKATPKLDSLIGEVEALLREKSPVKDFEKIATEIKDSFTSKVEYRILDDGTVYQKIS